MAIYLTIVLSIYPVTEPHIPSERSRACWALSYFKFLLWSNLRRSRSLLRLPSFKQRFNVKLSYFNSKVINSLSYELVPSLRSRNPPFHIPKNSMAKSTSSIPGSRQLRLSYELIAKPLAMPLLSSTTSTSISNHTFKRWFCLSFSRLKTIKSGPTSRFSTNSLVSIRIRTRYRKQRTSYTLSSKVLIRSMRSLLSLNVFCTRHEDKTGTMSIRLQLSVKDSILRSRTD